MTCVVVNGLETTTTVAPTLDRCVRAFVRDRIPSTYMTPLPGRTGTTLHPSFGGRYIVAGRMRGRLWSGDDHNYYLWSQP